MQPIRDNPPTSPRSNTIPATDLSLIPAGVDLRQLRDAARRALARRGFLPFVQHTKPDYVAEDVHVYLTSRLQAFVEACERKESPRLILKMPPQHGKSQLSSRQLPAWILGRNPKWRVALMSYSADWAHDLAHDARDVVTSEEYQALWPDHILDPSSTAVDDWGFRRKAGGGGMIAVGRDGSITGRSAEVLIIDDPVKSRKEADSETIRNDTWKAWPHFRNRVQKGGGILVVATQWHHDDLIGRLLAWAEEHPDADQYEVINLEALAPVDDPLGRDEGAALAPGRYDRDDLLKLRASMGEADWQALYCGHPTAQEGAVFLAEWFKYEHPPRASRGDWVFQAADTAYSEKRTADYTVVGTWRVEKNCFRLLDVYRKRMAFPELKQTIPVLAQDFDPIAVLVEDIGSGKSLAQELKADTKLPIIEWKPDRDKVSRANAVTHLFKSGKVILPIDAPWLRAYLSELLQFPASAHDDQVDMTTMALTWARDQQPKLSPTKQTTHEFTVDDDPEDEELADLWNDLNKPLRIEIARVRAKAVA